MDRRYATKAGHLNSGLRSNRSFSRRPAPMLLVSRAHFSGKLDELGRDAEILAAIALRDETRLVRDQVLHLLLGGADV